MNYKEYNWLLNDSVNSLERLNHIYCDLQYFLDSENVKRNFTKKYDDNLSDLFDKALLTVADVLVEMDNEKFANNPDENTVYKILDACNTLKDISRDLDEMLTNENYHDVNRILENEPWIIWYNMNNIKNEIL